MVLLIVRHWDQPTRMNPVVRHSLIILATNRSKSWCKTNPSTLTIRHQTFDQSRYSVVSLRLRFLILKRDLVFWILYRLLHFSLPFLRSDQAQAFLMIAEEFQILSLVCSRQSRIIPNKHPWIKSTRIQRKYAVKIYWSKRTLMMKMKWKWLASLHN